MASNEAAAIALYDSVWLDANRFYDAERRYFEVSTNETRRRQNPKSISSSKPKQPDGDSGLDHGTCSVLGRLEKLEKGHEAMQKQVAKLTSDMVSVLTKLSKFEDFMKRFDKESFEEVKVTKKDEPKGKIQNGTSAANANDDDDLDLFGSDEEEDDDAVKLREERLQAYANKKSKKPALVAKSSVVLDVKPWDDETDMKKMEAAVREISSDGLVWGASKLVPLAYGINKLQIVAVVEDEKVSIDWLQETISEIEDLVQSVDIAAFNKL